MTQREPAREQTASRGVLAYVIVVAVLAVAAVAVSWWLVGPPTDMVALVVLLVLGILSVGVQERDVGSKVTFSFLSIIMISSVALVGPVGSAFVGAVSVTCERRRRPAVARVFNGGMMAIQGAIGGLVYIRIGGATNLHEVEGPVALLMQVGVPLMVADAAQMLLNAVLLSGVVRLSSGVPPRRFLVQIISNSGVAYLGYGVIGFLFLILWVPADIGPFSAVLILAPLYVARWAFVQYGEEQRAHERALSALVTAVETKDPYASGHSGRVAQLTDWMSEPLGMGAQEAQDLRFAAMLHDVGKIGVPTRVLRPRTLTPPDLELLTRHPALGVVLVQDIEFLSGSLAGIRHHHERWDGLGYPDGLAGEQIPLISRVIAVADAFDALTTDRAERPALSPPQALKQLEQRRGRQFDATVVAALATALERHEWAVTTADEDELDRSGGYLDHDDPVAWERVWTTGAAPRAVNGSPARTEPSQHHVGEKMSPLTGVPDRPAVQDVRSP